MQSKVAPIVAQDARALQSRARGRPSAAAGRRLDRRGGQRERPVARARPARRRAARSRPPPSSRAACRRRAPACRRARRSRRRARGRPARPATRARRVSTRTPDSRGSAKCRTTRRGSGSVCPPTPRRARRTRPSRISAIATRSAVDDAIAKQMPCAAQDHGGVDADHVAARVDQRPAGVAGIERRVGLQHVVEQAAGLRAHRAAERADDAGGHRVLEAERAADRDRHLPDAHARRVAEADPREVARRHLEHGEVRVRIVADDLRGRRCARPAA